MKRSLKKLREKYKPLKKMKKLISDLTQKVAFVEEVKKMNNIMN